MAKKIITIGQYGQKLSSSIAQPIPGAKLDTEQKKGQYLNTRRHISGTSNKKSS
jgi:hypothetical protein